MMTIAGACKIAATIDVVLLSRIFKPPIMELSVELRRMNKPIIKVEIYGAGDRILKDFLINHIKMITEKELTIQ